MGMSQVSPKRIVLRFHEKYESESGTTIEKFFETFDINPQEDYFPELFPPDDSTKMHIVIDLYCKSHPAMDVETIPHEVFRVKKTDDFSYEKLNWNAPNEARARCSTLSWGATNRT